jgi:hypothetical protein
LFCLYGDNSFSYRGTDCPEYRQQGHNAQQLAKAFDNATYHCTSIVKIAGTQRSGLGYCKFMTPGGDFFVGELVLDSTGGGKWNFLQGAGRWKGITGGGEYVPLTSGKPIVAGTVQGCARTTGTYELSK